MRVVVVFESLFGDTRKVAEAIAEGARAADPHGSAECVRVGDADTVNAAAADLLIAGGPTQFLGLASDRRTGTYVRDEDVAAGHSRSGHDLEPGVPGISLREWLGRLGAAPAGARGAAFDTRLDKLLSGGAAAGIARRLRGHGYAVDTAPTGFIVEGMEGPLRAGELERAREWGARAVRQAAGAPHSETPPST